MKQVTLAFSLVLVAGASYGADQDPPTPPLPAVPEVPTASPAPVQSAPSRPLSILTDGYFVPPVYVQGGGAVKDAAQPAAGPSVDAKVPELPVIYED